MDQDFRYSTVRVLGDRLIFILERYLYKIRFDGRLM